MDPDANRKEQREIAERIERREDALGKQVYPSKGDRVVYEMDQAADGIRLAELVIALDEWILHGGFLPKEWHDVQVAKVLT